MTFPNSLRSQFELIEQLPGGKAIDCYRVRDIRRECAESVVRVLPEKFSADKEIVDRFHSFFTQFSSIPNRTFLPAVHSVTGVAGGNVFAVEEYVTGVPLPRFIELRRTSGNLQADVIEIFIKVCEALHHAHQRDIYHLCILPADILVDIKNPGRVKLVGFGAQIFITAGRLDSFSDHCRGYIAPEILDGKEPKTSGDIYSLATTIKDIFPEIGDHGDLLSRGLSRNPANRPARAREFAQSLKDLINKKIPQASERPTPNINSNSGGLLPIVYIKSEPIGAEVKLNGKAVGVTSDKGLSLSCSRDAAIEISKTGFQTETISFPDLTSKPEIVVKLKSAFRLFTNPWGAIVKVDGVEIGVTTREGLVIPWDQSEIIIEKDRYETKVLTFKDPPPNLIYTLELKLSGVLTNPSDPSAPKNDTSPSVHYKPNTPPSWLESHYSLLGVAVAGCALIALIIWISKTQQRNQAVIQPPPEMTAKTNPQIHQQKSASGDGVLDTATGNIILYPQPFKRIMDVVLKKASDQTVSWKDFRGKVVILYFWTTNCPPCLNAERDLSRLSHSLDITKLEILAINLTDSPQDIWKHAAENRLPFIVVQPGQGFGLEITEHEGRRTGFMVNPSREAILEVPAFPTTYVLDCRGWAIGYCVGAVQWDSNHNKNLIQKLLNEANACLSQ